MIHRRNFIITALATVLAAVLARFAPQYQVRAFLRQEDIQAAWMGTKPMYGDWHSKRASTVPVSMLQTDCWSLNRILITQGQIRRESRSMAKVINFMRAYGGGIRTDYYTTISFEHDDQARAARIDAKRRVIDIDLAALEERLAAQYLL